MTNARSSLKTVELVAAVILAVSASSSAQAQTAAGSSAQDQTAAASSAQEQTAAATAPFPAHPVPPFPSGPMVPAASALDGSPVSEQNLVNGHLPPTTPDGVGPSVDAPYRAPAKVSAATLTKTAGAAAATSFTATDWPTFGMNRQRTGNNPVETVLGVGNVGGLHQKWATNLKGPIWTQPTLATGVNVKGVLTDVVYVATLGGKTVPASTVALNAATGAIIWQDDLSPILSSPFCTDFNGSQGYVGFIGTPTIDRAHNKLYIVSGRGTLHAYDLATGANTTALTVQIPDPANDPPHTYTYGSPTLTGTSLYIATASSCDTSTPYHGQVVRVSITNGAILQRWYPTGANGPSGGGIWGPGGVSVPPNEAWVYALTGNALANPENAAFAEHVVKLTTTLAVSDSSAPSNNSAGDLDFGATATLFQPPGCPPMLAAFQKSGALYIYNRNSIGAGPMQTMQIGQGTADGENVGMPAYDPKANQLYVVAPKDSPTNFSKAGLLVLPISGSCSVSWKWSSHPNGASFGPSIPPVVANGVVYYTDGAGGHVYAVDPASPGSLPLWSFSSTQGIQGGIFASPMVVNGQLYIAEGGGGTSTWIRAFGL